MRSLGRKSRELEHQTARSLNERSPSMRAQRAESKSRRDNIKVAPSKRSTARGCGPKEVGWGGALPGAAASAALPRATHMPPRWGSGPTNKTPQPTPEVCLPAHPASVARRGCAFRHAGRSRSAAVVCNFLMRDEGNSLAEAMRRITAKRKVAIAAGLQKLLDLK